MASEVFKGLFGFSPDELTRQREAENEARAYKLAQLDPLQQTGFQAYKAASGIRDSVTDIGRSLFNIEDPQMKDASLMDQAFNEVNKAGVDPTSSAGLQQIGQLLTKQGASPKALERLSAAYQQAQLREAKLASEQALTAQRSREQDPSLKLLESGKYTPESVAAYKQSGDFSVLKFKDSDKEAKRSSFAQQLIDEGLQPGSPEFQQRMRQYNIADVEGTQKKGQTNITNVMPTSPSAKKISEASGEVIGKAIAGVGSQEEIINNSKKALDYLKKGIYTGPYAEAQKLTAKYTRGAIGDLAKVANTESFLNTIRNNVIPLLTAFGGNDSNEEKQFLERLVGGDTTLEPAAIQRAIETGIAKAEANIAKLRSQINAAETGQSLSTTISNQADPLGLFPQQGKK